MENLQLNLNLLAICLGSLLGATKASSEFTKGKACGARAIDLLLGVFCGVALATHFTNTGSVALSGMLALLGGVSGAMVIEVFMQMLPSIAKKTIKNWSEKLK